MSYNKTTWSNGDVITAQKMNNIENGIGNNGFRVIEFGGNGTQYETGLTASDFINAVINMTHTGYLTVLKAYDTQERWGNENYRSVVKLFALNLDSISELSNYNVYEFLYFPDDGTMNVEVAD